MADQNRALDRYLSPTDVWAMAFGCMVGWGVFAMPGNTFLPTAGPDGVGVLSNTAKAILQKLHTVLSLALLAGVVIMVISILISFLGLNTLN